LFSLQIIFMSFSVVLYSAVYWKRMNVIYISYCSRVSFNIDVLCLVKTVTDMSPSSKTWCKLLDGLIAFPMSFLLQPVSRQREPQLHKHTVPACCMLHTLSRLLHLNLSP
jgi:hypothetical protein